MTRVICVGHPLLTTDHAGPQLYKRLQKLLFMPEVELIDGGLQGLNLLRYFENCRRVILIDNVCGFLDNPGVIHLQGEQIEAAVTRHFDHAAGLAYLLAILPEVIDQLPQIELLGIEGKLTENLAEETIEQLQKLLGCRSAA